jgi:hypothetical protein
MNTEQLRNKIREIIKDETFKCQTKYADLSFELRHYMMLTDAEIVNDIRMEECQHAELFKILLLHIGP